MEECLESIVNYSIVDVFAYYFFNKPIYIFIWKGDTQRIVLIIMIFDIIEVEFYVLFLPP